MPALVPLNLDYTDRDFDSLRARLNSLIDTTFPTWTDRNRATFGNILVNLFAWVFDVLGYYQDAQAREAFIATATLRKNLIALSKLLNFSPSTARPATVLETFTLGAIPANNVVIPAETVVKNSNAADAVEFRLLAALTILAGANPPVGYGTVSNSEPQTSNFTSTGAASQQFKLPVSGYIDDTAGVTAGNGAYTEVDNFLSSTSSDRHYVVLLDEAGFATLRFGDGNNGAIPVGNIAVTYRTGGGAAGNLDAGAIKFVEGSFTDVLAFPVAVTVTNAGASSGGADPHTPAQIRQLAPASLRVLTRSVAREDFEILAETVNGVARALMMTSDELDGVPENEGYLYIISTGVTGIPSPALKAEVLAKVTVEYKTMATFEVTVQDPVFEVVNIQAIVYPQADVNLAVLKQRILDALADFFTPLEDDGTKNPNVDFGYYLQDSEANVLSEIALSDVLNVVRDVVGVRKVDVNDFLLNSANEDLTIGRNEFPKLGTVTLLNGDTGGAL